MTTSLKNNEIKYQANVNISVFNNNNLPLTTII
jgi:hypothetical protein